MASLVINGDTSGGITLSAPAVAGSNTQTLVAATGTLAPIVSGTVNAGGTAPFPSTGGPNVVDFTGIPSWVKRVTVMFSGVSTSGTSNVIVQVGSGSVTTSGYASMAQFSATATAFTAGFGLVNSILAASSMSGSVSISLISSNVYVENGNISTASGVVFVSAGTSPSLSGALDRVRITTVNGTDTFDAGTINILYE